jgi:hypothetical protein
MIAHVELPIRTGFEEDLTVPDFSMIFKGFLNIQNGRRDLDLDL